MLRHPSGRYSLIPLLVALAAVQSGCATKFVAKSVNPLKPAKTAGWDPGELSNSTNEQIDRLRLPRSWRDDPAATIRALEPRAAADVRTRRAIIEVALAAGIRAHEKFLTDRGAAGFYLCAAEHAFDGASQGDAECQKFCREATRYAIARLAGLREVALKNGIRLGNDIVGPSHTYHVVLRKNAPGAVPLDHFKTVVPTDRYKIGGMQNPAVIDGVGAPLIGKIRGPSGVNAAKEFTMEDDLWMPLTATVQFGPRGARRDAIFTIYDRKNTETVQIGGRREVLAGDFSTSFAVRTAELNKESMLTLGILGFLRGDRFFERTGLYPLEFPRTDKIPVVFVHGLISEPNDWRFLHSALLSHPEIRQRYQFWAFYYPTSMAVPWSSTIFRRELKRVQQRMNPGERNPQLNHMVLVGHSMGGLLSRLQISQGGDKIYGEYFTKPVDRLRLSERDRAMIRDMFYFSPNPDISEVIFVCVPHQGSGLATNWIGRIGRALAKLPLTIITTSANVLMLNADALARDVSVKPGTSIDSLSPGGKFTEMLKDTPMSPRVVKYSIIGNRGKPGDLAQSSDGVVPYWSSHLDGVPETIIPSTHSGPEYPECASKVSELLSQRLSGAKQKLAETNATGRRQHQGTTSKSEPNAVRAAFIESSGAATPTAPTPPVRDPRQLQR